MRSAKITVKNYRCFTDDHPLRIHLGAGSIAFIGPNNSGKSAALKLFHECRELWTVIAHHINRPFSGVIPLNFGFNFLFPVDDPERIFSLGNKRDISITFEFEDTEHAFPTVKYVYIKIPRANPRIALITMKASNGVEFDHIAPHPAAMTWTLPKNDAILVALVGLELFQALAESFYIGAFRNAINQTGTEDYYDIKVGSDFVRLFHAWKSGTGPNSISNARKILAITKTIKDMYGFSQLEINPTTTNRDFNVIADGDILPLSDLGSGLAQCLIVLSNVAIKSPRMVLVDEPELNLHPALQQRFVEQLAEFAPDGIIFATHSLGLARTTAEKLYSFNRTSGKTLVHLYEAIPNLVEFLGEMSFAAQREIGYDRILLVEGLHDIKVFKQFLRLYGLEHKTVVLFLGGSQMATADRDHELAEIKRLTANVFVIVDSERETEDDRPIEKRLALEASCKKASIPILLTKFRAIENHFTDRSVKDALGNSYSALPPYQPLKDSKNGWTKADNWRIAGQMTKAEIDPTDIGEFLREVLGH